MSERNGGPYTKSEQEKRRMSVYEMHFEKGQSALHIAEILGVNRHTITDDIRYWYSELASEFDEIDVKNLLLKQHSRMELQRDRLEKMLNEQKDIHVTLKIEKMIFELDCAIAKMIVPICNAQNSSKVTEQEAIQTVEHLIAHDEFGKITGYSDKEILQDIIEYKKCDLSHANMILDKIRKLGLDLYLQTDEIVPSIKYDLLGFAEKRNILSDEKLQEVYSKIEKRAEDQRTEIAEMRKYDKEIEAKFVAKYGPEESWSMKVWEEFNIESSKFDSLP